MTIIDLLGHGRSAKPVEPALYETLSLVSDVEAIISELSDSRTKKVVLVGHSLGMRRGSTVCVPKGRKKSKMCNMYQ